MFVQQIVDLSEVKKKNLKKLRNVFKKDSKNDR